MREKPGRDIGSLLKPERDMYEVKRIRCDCHPETCCCHDFELVLNGERMASANDEHALKIIAETLNWAYVQKRLASTADGREI